MNASFFKTPAWLQLVAAAALCGPLAAALADEGVATLPPLTMKTQTVLKGLVNPWSVAFLPDGRMLVTEKAGTLRLATADAKLSGPLPGVPAVDAAGQCGLLDVVADPAFASTQRIYFTFAQRGERGNSTAVARARLVGAGLEARLEDVRVIFTQQPTISSRSHCGSRIVLDRSGHLLVGLGDRFSAKEEAQNPANHIGKVVRIDGDGKPAPGNPYIDKPGSAPEVWSLGHRNIQGAALHPGSGELWAVEHGPQGGDELNRIERGANHGWPLLTFGRNYGLGTRIGEEGPKPGFVQPVRHWVPTSLAPSGLAFLSSNRYPGWQGNLFMGTLRGEQLVRLVLQGERVVAEQRLMQDAGHRIRDVRQGPDGWLYLLTDSAQGELLRLLP